MCGAVPVAGADPAARALDRELDEELDDTFPASDPPKVTRVPTRDRITGDADEEGKA
ncbi:hypothetical protein AAII07_42525 [Microvirga sp. 0TCS3.31]